MLKRLLGEPLLHFAVGGAALFALHAAVAPPDREAGDAAGRILVTSGRIDQLAVGFTRTWQRPPTAEELSALVEDHIREEIFYREALAMGLDREDIIVRRRMRQKFEFLLGAAAEQARPTDAELREILERDAEEFPTEPLLALRQVYFPIEGGREKASQALSESGGGAAGEILEGHGAPSLLPPALELSPLADIAKVFGDAFAARLASEEPGGWIGPVESAYGWHLVRITGRSEAEPATLEHDRVSLEARWLDEKRRELLETTYRQLRERYDIEVEEAHEPPGPAATGADEAR